MHERILRGSVGELYDNLNENPEYTMPALKGELVLIISPYISRFNKGKNIF